MRAFKEQRHSVLSDLSRTKVKKEKYVPKLLTPLENVTFNWIGIMQSGVTRRSWIS